MTPQRLSILEPALLVIHALGTGAATAVLAIWPAAIPAVAGVKLGSEQFILCYFLSGSEAALCLMCIQALRSQQRDLRRMTFQVLIVFHGFTVALSVVWMLHAANLVVILNIAVRVVLASLLAVAVMSRSSGGRDQSQR
jgi:hypothetical protein